MSLQIVTFLTVHLTEDGNSWLLNLSCLSIDESPSVDKQNAFSSKFNYKRESSPMTN